MRAAIVPLLVVLCAAIGCGGDSSGPDGPSVATVTLTAPDSTVIVGGTVQLSADVRDAQGQAVTGQTISWQSGSAAVVTVTSSGLATAVAGGSAAITATVAGITGSLTIIVLNDASVVVVDGSVDRPNPFEQNLTLHLRNNGGPGVYKIDVWGLPTTPNGPETFMGETEPVEVTAGYEETLTYDVGTSSFVKYVLVFTRNQGSAVYQQTDRFDVP